MPYLIGYDPLYDEEWQEELDTVSVEIAQKRGWTIHNTPRNDLPITSRFREVRHPNWIEETKRIRQALCESES